MATAGSIVDSKALAVIAKWNGDKDSFKVWQFDILAYVGQHCPALREKMLQIPLNSNPVDVALLSADETKLNAQLFYAFTLVTEGAAKVTLMNCPYGNGLEFYRQVASMVQPVTKAHQRTTLLSLAEAKDLPASYRERVAQWETRITEYNRRADVDAEFPEDLKIATYQAKIAPERVREHLLLNESRLSTYKLMRDEVESVMLARDAQAPDDDSAMVIGSYEEKGEVLGALSERPGKGKSKGKKGKDKKGNKGGGRGDEGKENRDGPDLEDSGRPAKKHKAQDAEAWDAKAWAAEAWDAKDEEDNAEGRGSSNYSWTSGPPSKSTWKGKGWNIKGTSWKGSSWTGKGWNTGPRWSNQARRYKSGVRLKYGRPGCDRFIPARSWTLCCCCAESFMNRDQ